MLGGWNRLARRTADPVWRGWAASRVVVLAALAVAHLSATHPNASLLSWDAAWYRDISAVGYTGSPPGAIRFFPGWPLLGRAVSSITALPAGVVLVVLANLLTLILLHQVRDLARAEGLDEVSCRRTVYLTCFAPAAFVLVMGYSEALFGVVTCAVLRLGRSGRWWMCVLPALAAGALRPTGVLLVVFVVVEAVRQVRRWAHVFAAAAAALAPVLGTAAYLGWVAASGSEVWTPYRAQTAGDLRGGLLVSPVTTVGAGVARLTAGSLDSGLLVHVLWLPVVAVLVVVAVRRLAASLAALAVVSVLVAVTAGHLGSFERYTGATVPLVLAAAVALQGRPRAARLVAVILPVVLFVLALRAFTVGYVP